MAVGRITVAYGLWMAAVAIAFLAVPPLRNGTIAVLSLSAAAAIGYGVRRFRPAKARAWLMLAAALVLSAAGRITYDLLPGPVGTMKPYIWVVHVIQLAMFAAVVAGLLGLARVPGRARFAVVDLAILLLGAGLLIGVLVAVPYALTPEISGAQAAARIGYVVQDVLFLVTALYLAASVRWTWSAVLLVAGSLGFVTHCLLFRLGRVHGQWPLDAIAVELGWLLFLAAWGAAALLPAMATLGGPSGTARQGAMVRLGLVAGASVLPFTLLLVDVFGGEDHSFEPLVATAATVMLVLVLARMVGIAVQLRRQVAAERVLRDAVSDLANAADPDAVPAVLAAAVPKLLPPRAHHGVLVGDGQTSPPPGGHDVPAGPGSDTTPAGQLLPAAALPASVTRRLGADGFVLTYPLTPNGQTGTAPERRILYVRSDRASLMRSRPLLEVLTSQASLTLDRMRLTDEVIRNANEEHFRTLVQNSADVILVVDDDDRIAFASPSAGSIFGTARLRGAWLPGFVDEGQRPAVRRLLARTRAGEVLLPGKRLSGYGALPDGAWGAGRRDGGVTPRAAARGEAVSAPRTGEAQPAGAADWVNLAEWAVGSSDGSLVPVEVGCRRVFGGSSVRGLVLDLHDVTERRRLEQELTQRALRDPLTGLVSRLALREMTRQAVERWQGTGSVVGVLAVDLDDFKMVNDQVGYEVGDAVLKVVAHRLTEALPPGSTAGRLGGDAFAALVEEMADPARVDEVAARVAAAIARPIRVGQHIVTCSASVGVATTAEADNVGDLTRQADLSLHAARHLGRGKVRHYDPSIRRAIVDRLELRSALERALDEHALRLEYQPIVGLDCQLTAGFEALLRWQHPTRGWLLPDEFIDAAEESGQIVSIGDWVLATAMREARGWEGVAGDRPPYVGVNVSARQFRSAGFVDCVRRRLAETGLEPSRLHLEITESLLLRDDDRVWDDLQRLRTLGVRVAIDDFGTGYSALSYLRHVPLDVIKLDRLFVSTMAASARQRGLVEGIVGLARVLHLTVVAEGIETEVERELLAGLGCDYGQGFLFSRPLPGEDALRWLAAERDPVERHPVERHPARRHPAGHGQDQAEWVREPTEHVQDPAGRVVAGRGPAYRAISP